MTKSSRKAANEISTPVVIVIAAVIILIIVLLANSFSSQSPSDCSSAENYDKESKKCILMTKAEYLQSIKSTINDAIYDKKQANYRNGTLCIPADETPKYVGVNGCVRMYVRHYWIESYGWAWLDAQQISYQNGDFSVAALGRGIITKADAEYYLGNFISVHGTIELYDGETQIRINSKSAITDVSKENTPYLTQYSNLENKYRKDIEKIAGDCFETGIKNANNKKSKDNVYINCKNSI